jgi:hypothetical protein
MNGKVLMVGLLGIAMIAGAGLWYSMERAYYTHVTGVTEVFAYGDAFPVTEYEGIDANTSPLKMRACFKVNWDYTPTEEFKDIATPLQAPSFFDCFNAEQITADMQTGGASAIMAEENKPYGFDRYITQYPDGRAFMWRQINHCGEAWFGGDDLPSDCPEPKTEIIEEIDDTIIQGSNEAAPVEDVQNTQVVKAPIEEATEVNTVMPVEIEIAEINDEAAIEKTSTDLAKLEPVQTSIRLKPYIGPDAELIEVQGLKAVAVSSDPTTFRGCFKAGLSYGFLTETYQIYEAPKPAASAHPCFDADQLQADLDTGHALAFVGEQDIHPGIDRVVAIYDDGRAYAWHQKSKSE